MAEESNWGEDSLKDKLKKEKNKFMALSTEEKVDYYKSYYLVPTLIAFAIVAFVLIFVKDVYFTKRIHLMNGVVINTEVNDKAEKYITDDMKAFLKGDTKGKDKDILVTYTALHFTVEDGAPINSDFKNVMSFDTMLQAGNVGYILCDASGLEYVEDLDVGFDITTVLSEEEKDKLSDKLIIAYSNSLKENVPIGINIYGTKLAKMLGADSEDCNFVLVYDSQYKKNYRKLLDYVLYN